MIEFGKVVTPEINEIVSIIEELRNTNIKDKCRQFRVKRIIRINL